MTTIVYKDGVLAGDRLITFQDQVFGESSKVFLIKDYAVGLAGSLAVFPDFLKFVAGEDFNKAVFDKEVSFDAVVIHRETKEITTYAKNLIAEKIEKIEFIALGSGASIAKGALLMGATPSEAIKIAAKIDLFTNDNIDEIIL